MGGLLPGDPAPWFQAPCLEGNPRFSFDSIAGRHVVLLLLGSAGAPHAPAALRAVAAHRDLFDDVRACFFGITYDPADAPTGKIGTAIPGIRWFLDYDRAVTARFRSRGADVGDVPHFLLLDPMLRVVARADIHSGGKLLGHLRTLLAQPQPEIPAPILVMPRIFEPDFCRQLIARHEEEGGKPTGFMREIDGKTMGVIDERFKRRSDYTIPVDDPLRDQIRARINRFLVPQIERAFQFQATRLERYIVACYDSGEGGEGGGFFRPHRDNTTPGTAHRRFACTINLNADDYDGGDLIFPEFGQRRYRAPTGGAVVFSCSLLHEATRVSRGRRYACLPFLYDEPAAQQREAIAKSGRVAADLANYRANQAGGQ